jgi:hypothetical protein
VELEQPVKDALEPPAARVRVVGGVEVEKVGLDSRQFAGMDSRRRGGAGFRLACAAHAFFLIEVAAILVRQADGRTAAADELAHGGSGPIRIPQGASSEPTER